MARAPVKPKAKEVVTEVQILEMSQGSVSFCLLGTSELYFNRMSEKMKRYFLLGGQKKNEAEKAANIKHDPPAEFRDSVYRNPGPKPATRLKLPAPAFKGLIRTAALDMPGSTKSAIGRRVWIPGTSIDVYGVPVMGIDVVRSADMAHTPDMRTRAVLLEWCCEVTVRFVRPLVTARQIAALVGAGGILCGVGDWRQEKGSGNAGQFQIVEKTNADFKRIMREGGRVAQDNALEHITFRDVEVEELYGWFVQEIARRGRDKDDGKPANDAGDDLAEAAD